MSYQNISIANNRMDKRILPALARALVKESLATNSTDDYRIFCEQLEQKIASKMGVKDCLLTNSGTDAILLALLGLGLKKGDEVIVPASAYIAVASAVHYAGAQIVPVDISPDNMQMSLELVAKKISRKTRAIMMIHMSGQCCDIDGFKDIARKKKITLIENACQAFGTCWRGAMVGSFGFMGTLSFSYAKTLASFGGHGGALLLHSSLRKKKISDRYLNVNKGHRGLFSLPGRVSRIGFLDALSIRVKLDSFHEIEAKKRECLTAYDSELKEIPQISVFADPPHVVSVRPFYLIMAKERDLLNRFLFRHKIVCEKGQLQTMAFRQSPNSRLKDFPIAVSLAQNSLRLPLFPLMEAEEVFYVARRIKEFYGKK